MSTPRAYLLKDVCEKLAISRRNFFLLRRAGQLPMVQELTPRIGRVLRFKAEPIERWLRGEWGQPRSFSSHRRAS